MGFTYEVRIRGRLSPTLLSQFEHFERFEHSAGVGPVGIETVLRGDVADQAALHGLLRQIEALGLDLVELRRLPVHTPR